MLTINEKTLIFKNYLDVKNGSYADEMKDELYFFFFINENSFNFLKKLNTKEDIFNRVDSIISRMIMHEDEDELSNIIEIYLIE
jgi:hypothetical protein